jgi:aspartate aminotransferase
MGPAFIIAKMRAILSHVGAWAPMAEQKAVAKFLLDHESIKRFLENYKAELEERLTKIFEGFMQLKEEGYQVDAVAPEAAIYLTIIINLVGKKTATGEELQTQEEVTSYILKEAGLAVVPFNAFGVSKSEPWYRLSVGTCKKEEIDEMISKLREALSKLS